MSSETGNDALYLGIDGGGTHCRGRLRSSDGSLIGEAMAGAANTRLGVASAHNQILSIAMEILDQAGLDRNDLARTHLGAGLAGLHIEKDRKAFLDWTHPFASLEANNDAHIACLGAHGGVDDGGIFIMGTGSCGYGLLEGKSFNVGGWGFMLSDDASGAQTGYRALRHALAALDGIVEGSPMTDQILFHFGDRQEEMVLWAAEAKPADYGHFARYVVNHADKGDKVATDLMKKCGSDASAMLRVLARHGLRRICLMGGFAEFVEPWLEADVTALLVPRLYDARDGAVLMAGGTLPKPDPSSEIDMGPFEGHGFEAGDYGDQTDG